MLLKLKDQAEIVIVISADDIEQSKHQGDLELPMIRKSCV